MAKGNRQSAGLFPRYLCKVGGSLFDWNGFPAQLQRFLNQLDHPVLLLAGGGEPADLVRLWDRLFHLGEQHAHHLAIESMSLTASLLARILPESCVVGDQGQLEAAIKNGQTPILNAANWIDRLEADAKINLPHTWDITSDSIALWLAAEMEIEHLILLKSVDYPVQTSLQMASHEGLIDIGFPDLFKKMVELGHRTTLHWHNLRRNTGPAIEIG